MINWAVRYQPILKELKSLQPSWVLDVGSGPEGLKLFWRGVVIGIDLRFKRVPIHQGVNASGLALPFADNSSPVVVSCDMLEHVPPSERENVIAQLARVTNKTLLITFPSGEISENVYRELANQFRSRNMPVWLKEHLEFGLPEEQKVVEWLNRAGWVVQTRWYESAIVHKKLMCWENQYPGKLLTYSLMRLVGPLIAPRLLVPSSGPNLRVFIKAEKAPINISRY